MGLGDRLDEIRSLPDVEIRNDGTKRGFAGGCNLGAAGSTADYIALVNSDAVIAPDTLSRLVEVAARPEVGRKKEQGP